MTNRNMRREILKGGLALAGLSVFGIPEWALPALAQGETLVLHAQCLGGQGWRAERVTRRIRQQRVLQDASREELLGKPRNEYHFEGEPAGHLDGRDEHRAGRTGLG